MNNFTGDYYEAPLGAFNAVLLLRDDHDDVDVIYHVIARTDGEFILPDRGFNECRDMDTVNAWADQYGFTLVF